MRTVCISVLRVASGPSVKLATCKSALNPRWFTLLTALSVGPGVRVTLCCFLFYSMRRFVLCLTLCYFVLVFFSPFSIAITSVGEAGANLSAFRTFVRFVLVWFCRFPLPLGVWEGLKFVIVALPGLFSYLFLPQGRALFSLWVIYPCKHIDKIHKKKIHSFIKATIEWTIMLCFPGGTEHNDYFVVL